MKKVITFFSVVLFVFTAKTASAQAEIDKGNVLLNGGIGLGYYYGGGGGTSLTFSAEWAINNFISIGPYLGFANSSYHYYGYKYNYTFIDLGARGSYHFSQHLNLSTNKLDLYGGVGLGYVISDYSGDNNSAYEDNYPASFRGSLFGGARWYFSDKFAANGEVGFGYAPLILGVTYKL